MRQCFLQSRLTYSYCFILFTPIYSCFIYSQLPNITRRLPSSSLFCYNQLFILKSDMFLFHRLTITYSRCLFWVASHSLYLFYFPPSWNKYLTGVWSFENIFYLLRARCNSLHICACAFLTYNQTFLWLCWLRNH